MARTKRYQVSISAGLYRRMKAHATAHGTSLTDVANNALFDLAPRATIEISYSLRRHINALAEKLQITPQKVIERALLVLG